MHTAGFLLLLLALDYFDFSSIHALLVLFLIQMGKQLPQL